MAVPSAKPQPALSYWERNPPYAALALAAHLGLELPHAADAKARKGTPHTLAFAGGCAVLLSAQELLMLSFITRIKAVDAFRFALG